MQVYLEPVFNPPGNCLLKNQPESVLNYTIIQARVINVAVSPCLYTILLPNCGNVFIISGRLSEPTVYICVP